MRASSPDLAYSPLSFADIAQILHEKNEHIVAPFRTLTLDSHYQPIISLAHCKTVGFEALLRATKVTGEPLPPTRAFAMARTEAELVSLDRMCRAIHLRNFAAVGTQPTWLFLNVNPQVIVDGNRYGSFFSELLDSSGFAPHRVVIEILESALHDEHKLDEAVQYYRDLGCMIAIDDFGAGHSNFDRVWRLRPDIVKFDRSIVVRAAADRGIRSIVTGMVSLVHEAGSMVLMEGIETHAEAMIAMESDADFVQGYYFGRPARSISSLPSPVSILEQLFQDFSDAIASGGASYRTEIAAYIDELGFASELVESGRRLAVASKRFLELPLAERCFLLDKRGYQVGVNVTSRRLSASPDAKHLPMSDSSSANWSRRHYFRRALAQPGKVHVTRPYLSAPTASPCITLSIAVQIAGELCVLCGDVSWGTPLTSGLQRTFA